VVTRTAGSTREDNEGLLTTAQVADHLQLTVAVARTAIRDGGLRASLPAGRRHGYRIERGAVRDWLADTSARPQRSS